MPRKIRGISERTLTQQLGERITEMCGWGETHLRRLKGGAG